MASVVTLIRASGLYPAADYVYAATAPADARIVFLAGSCPLDAQGETVGVGDYAAQAAACVENLVIALAAAGAGITDVIGTRVLVASGERSDLVAAWRVVREAFGDHDVPSTLLASPCSATATNSSRWKPLPRCVTDPQTSRIDALAEVARPPAWRPSIGRDHGRPRCRSVGPPTTKLSNFG